jgi:hypothetical protein
MLLEKLLRPKAILLTKEQVLTLPERIPVRRSSPWELGIPTPWYRSN